MVRPADTGEVAAVIAACREHGAAIVPQGGNTGLVGAGVPRGGEVLLSLARLDALGAVDPATAQVSAGAGVTMAALQGATASAGFDAGIDFAARDSATVGGLVACDAGERARWHTAPRGHGSPVSRRCWPTARWCSACTACSRTTRARRCRPC